MSTAANDKEALAKNRWMLKVSARAEAFFVYRKGRVAERAWMDPVKGKEFVFVADPCGLPLKFESF
ncbi:hypothetical protein BA724_06765 [Domibacillus iocasae]|uniref:Uncharacterized protein n=1 Tax=Domibacillus iocasae TaxID=1714016 RepID=A0A1E7DPI5_9BACI|nr:hypothetical protein BA724_06765 [Domibacillus iocasae]